MGDGFLWLLLLLNLGASLSFWCKGEGAWGLIYLGASLTLSGSLWLRR